MTMKEMKKVLMTGILMAFILALSPLYGVTNQQSAFKVATVRNHKLYKGSVDEYGPSGQIIVHEWQIDAKPGELTIVALEDENCYAVDPDNEAIVWLNRNIPGDILSGLAPVHDLHDNHLGLFKLHPGTYHLTYLDYNRVLEMDGYKKAKALFGDRLQLLAPVGHGHHVGIRIYGPYDKLPPEKKK
jgi:hypothetical protein